MAGGRIKGITIEIGGDTTKLDKALKGTNSEISKTQKALKDVERLLKIDPGNTELLAQKERYLAQQIEQTSEKAKKLKEFIESADGAVARKQDFEKKYAPLIKSLAEASSSYEKLKAKDAEMRQQFEAGEISTEDYDKWNAKVKSANKSLSDLRKQHAAAKKEMGGPMMDQSQFDALQREYAQTAKEAKEAEKAAKSFNSEISGFSGSMSQVSNGAASVSSAFEPVTEAIFAVGTAAVATVPATEEFRADLSMLDNNARMAGVGIDSARQAFEQFASVSNEVDSSVEATSNLLQAGFTESNLQMAVENLAGAYLSFPDTLKIESLADSLQETIATGEATGQFAEALERLGVNLDDFNKKMSETTSETGRQDLALGTLASNGMQDVYNSWVENNGALLENRKATMQFKQSMAELAEIIQPILTSVMEALGRLLSWFSNLDSGTLQMLLSVLFALGAIGPIASTISMIAGTVSTISTGVTMLTGALGAFNITSAITTMTLGKWVLIIGGVVLAVWLLVAAFNALTGKTQKVEMPELPEVPGVTSGGRGRPSQQPSGGRMRAVTASDLPHLAQGTVTRPNSPFMAVVGDNPQEPEIIAPYSTVKRAARDAMAETGMRGGAQAITINFTGDLAQLARVLHPYITSEGNRLGPNLVT